MKLGKITQNIRWRRWPWLLVAAAGGVMLFLSIRTGRQAGGAAMVAVWAGLAAALLVAYLIARGWERRR